MEGISCSAAQDPLLAKAMLRTVEDTLSLNKGGTIFYFKPSNPSNASCLTPQKEEWNVTNVSYEVMLLCHIDTTDILSTLNGELVSRDSKPNPFSKLLSANYGQKISVSGAFAVSDHPCNYTFPSMAPIVPGKTSPPTASSSAASPSPQGSSRPSQPLRHTMTLPPTFSPTEKIKGKVSQNPMRKFNPPKDKEPSSTPSTGPSSQPSSEPTLLPTESTESPSPLESGRPTRPSIPSSRRPTESPTVNPTGKKKEKPTDSPIIHRRPTTAPTAEPSPAPTARPSYAPSAEPSPAPTEIGRAHV